MYCLKRRRSLNSFMDFHVLESSLLLLTSRMSISTEGNKLVKTKFLILLVICSICLLSSIYIYNSEFNDHLEEFHSFRAKPKVILYWTRMYNTKDFYFGFGNLFKDCTYYNCFMTDNRRLMNIEDYDAIFFHAVDYILKWYGAPKKRSPHQRYVFYCMEPPYLTGEAPLKNFYNWTMTYREDSDVLRPSGLVVAEKRTYNPPRPEDIRRRNKKIAWFVSHCETQNKREKLAEAIGREIPVDVYGKCGKFVCDKGNQSECYKNLERDYKFYLSFENSICDDYVTEKLFGILNLDIVPIVYGGANYDKIAPPHSVIDVSKYNNVSDLVNYIKRLDNNVTEYLEYFKWKQDFVVKSSKQRILCNLCEKLNQPIVNKVYEDISKWWKGADKPACRGPPKYIET